MNTIADIVQLPNVSFLLRSELPAIAGVYFVVDDILRPRPTLDYVGQAQDIRQRWLYAHHRANLITPFHTIHWMPISDDLDRLREEELLIRHFKPRWNDKHPDQIIQDLTSRLWNAEWNAKSLRLSLWEANRTINALSKEVCGLYDTYKVDVRKRYGIEEDELDES